MERATKDKRTRRARGDSNAAAAASAPERRAGLPRLLTPEQAAEALSVSPWWLQCDRIGPRRIAFVRLGRHIRYREADILAALEQMLEGGELGASRRRGAALAVNEDTRTDDAREVVSVAS